MNRWFAAAGRAARGMQHGVSSAARPMRARDETPLTAAHIGRVVPTAGNRSETLTLLVEDSGLNREHIYVIRTRQGAAVPDGVSVIDDFGPINIHRWWNAGMDAARRDGLRIAVVSNDDVVVGSMAMIQLAQAVQQAGATLATPGTKRRLIRRGLPLRWYLDGSLWAVDLTDGLEADEGYSWWMGDRDLEVRARTEFNGLATVPVQFEHSPGSDTEVRDDLQRLATADMQRFGEHHMVVTRAMKHFQSLPPGVTSKWPRWSGTWELPQKAG